MATIALPMRELKLSYDSAERARNEAERVVRHSVARRANKITALKVIAGSLALKWLFWGLARHQSKLIDVYKAYDFNQCRPEQLDELATKLDNVLEKERDMLEKVGTLGAELRALWTRSFCQLTEQVDYLETIADSLHAAADHEVTALLAFAADEISGSAVAACAAK